MSHPSSSPLPGQSSPLRVQRLQTAHYLRIIASLQARIDELGNEHAQLEAIIAAQMQEISTLRQAAAKASSSELALISAQ